VKWSTLTTPPRPRRPLPKAPLFTREFQSTKSFSPGHIVGTGILVLGVVGITKLFVDRGKEEAARARRLAESSSPQPGHPASPASDPKLAQVENARGMYGKQR
jgi:hypothetical protein